MQIRDLVKRDDKQQLPVRRIEDSTAYPQLMQDMVQWADNWNRVFDDLFSRAFGGSLLDGSNFGWNRPSLQAGNFIPAISLSESDKEYTLTAELPGLSESDVDLSVNNNVLIIKGEKKQEHEDKGKNYYHMERAYGTFHRNVPLPEGVDESKIEAQFNKGVLTVTMPKSPELQQPGHKIEIKTGTQGSAKGKTNGNGNGK